MRARALNTLLLLQGHRKTVRQRATSIGGVRCLSRSRLQLTRHRLDRVSSEQREVIGLLLNKLLVRPHWPVVVTHFLFAVGRQQPKCAGKSLGASGSAAPARTVASAGAARPLRACFLFFCVGTNRLRFQEPFLTAGEAARLAPPSTVSCPCTHWPHLTAFSCRSAVPPKHQCCNVRRRLHAPPLICLSLLFAPAMARSASYDSLLAAGVDAANNALKAPVGTRNVPTTSSTNSLAASTSVATMIKTSARTTNNGGARKRALHVPDSLLPDIKEEPLDLTTSLTSRTRHATSDHRAHTLIPCSLVPERLPMSGNLSLSQAGRFRIPRTGLSPLGGSGRLATGEFPLDLSGRAMFNGRLFDDSLRADDEEAALLRATRPAGTPQ